MSENVRNPVSEVVSLEVLKRLSKDGVCVILQSGDSEFRFIPPSVIDLDLVKIAQILIEAGCPEEKIELILEKIERSQDV